MENDVVEKERGQWTPSFITLNGSMDWDRKVEAVMGSADARKLIDSFDGSFASHWYGGMA